MPLGPPDQRRPGTDQRRRAAGDSRMAAGHSLPDTRPQAKDSEAPRPTGTLRRGPRLTSTASGGVEGPPPTQTAGGPPVRPAARAPAHRGHAAAGGPLVRPAAGALAHGGPAGGAPAGGAHPAAPAPPEKGTAEDLRQQAALGFAHDPFGRGDPKGNSWSEKFNMWLHRVGSPDGRDRRVVWETWQEGGPWRATLLVRPRPWPAGWERDVRYPGSPFSTKRDAKEDACRFLLEEQCRLGRLPDLTAPTPLLEQVAGAPGQGVADRPTAGGVAGQAASALPRPRLVVPVAKTPPTTPRAQQQDAPALPPAADPG